MCSENGMHVSKLCLVSGFDSALDGIPGSTMSDYWSLWRTPGTTAEEGVQNKFVHSPREILKQISSKQTQRWIVSTNGPWEDILILVFAR